MTEFHIAADSRNMFGKMTKHVIRILQFAALFLAIFAAKVFAVDIETSASPKAVVRVPQTSLGIMQLANEKLDWFLDAKFGMFIHWGLYSGVGRGEWVMEHEGILPEKYRQYAYPESGE